MVFSFSPIILLVVLLGSMTLFFMVSIKLEKMKSKDHPVSNGQLNPTLNLNNWIHNEDVINDTAAFIFAMLAISLILLIQFGIGKTNKSRVVLRTLIHDIIAKGVALVIVPLLIYVRNKKLRRYVKTLYSF